MNSFSTPIIISIALLSLALTGTATADVQFYSQTHGPSLTRAVSASAVPAAVLGGQSRQGEPVVASVSRNRRTVALHVSYVADCDSLVPTFRGLKLAAAKVKKNGNYKVARTLRMRFDDGYGLILTYSAKGKLTKRGTASGSFQILEGWFKPDGSRDDSCSTGAQSYKVADAGTLAGSASNGFPVVMKHTPSRDFVTWLKIPWMAACKSDTLFLGTTTSISGPIGSGKFATTLRPQPADMPDGRQLRITQTVDAAVGRTAAGTWQVTASIVDSAGNEVDTCDSGLISFRLK